MSTVLWSSAAALTAMYVILSLTSRNGDGPTLAFVVAGLIMVGGILKAVGS